MNLVLTLPAGVPLQIPKGFQFQIVKFLATWGEQVLGKGGTSARYTAHTAKQLFSPGELILG